MKTFAELTQSEKEKFTQVYEKNTYEFFQISKIYAHNHVLWIKGFKEDSGQEDKIPANELYPHPYFPMRIPNQVELMEPLMGNLIGNTFYLQNRDTARPVAVIKSNWKFGDSILLLYLPMLYANPEAFKPIYE